MTMIAITGIGGFIGLRAAERALERDWEVRGIDVDPQGVQRARELGAEAAVGSVEQPQQLRECFAGVDVVLHTAAIVDESGDPGRFEAINVEGTRNVAEAALDADVRRLVHLSSVMVYGFDYPDGIDESFEAGELTNIYCRTKRDSERVARQFDDDPHLGVIVIRPGDVYGARSRPWVLRPLEMMKSGLFRLPEGGRGLINHVHVDNLLDAVFAALDQDATGEVFNVTDGEPTEAAQFFAHHATMLGEQGVATAPTVLLKAFAAASAPLFGLFGAEPPASPEALRFLCRSGTICSQKARRQLDYEPRLGLDEGMGQVEGQLREAGLLSRD